jgi:hypothetical protein
MSDGDAPRLEFPNPPGNDQPRQPEGREDGSQNSRTERHEMFDVSIDVLNSCRPDSNQTWPVVPLFRHGLEADRRSEFFPAVCMLKLMVGTSAIEFGVMNILTLFPDFSVVVTSAIELGVMTSSPDCST